MLVGPAVADPTVTIAPLHAPVLHTPVLHTPVLHTPVLHTPVLHTPVLHTPVLHTCSWEIPFEPLNAVLTHSLTTLVFYPIVVSALSCHASALSERKRGGGGQGIRLLYRIQYIAVSNTMPRP